MNLKLNIIKFKKWPKTFNFCEFLTKYSISDNLKKLDNWLEILNYLKKVKKTSVSDNGIYEFCNYFNCDIFCKILFKK